MGSSYIELKGPIADLFEPLQNEKGYVRHRIGRLAHYTSADAFSSIIRNGQIWMSNLESMNDFEEIKSGAQIVRDVFVTSGERIFEDDVFNNVLEQFDLQMQSIRPESYAWSLSEYDQSANISQQLPMWNRYGADGDGICMIFKKDNILLDVYTGDPIYWTPMYYRSAENFRDRIKHVLSHCSHMIGVYYMQDECTVGDEYAWFGSTIVWVLIALAMSHKHEA